MRVLLGTLILALTATASYGGDHVPKIRGGRNGDLSQLVANYDGLQISKVGNHKTGRIDIALVYGTDSLTIEARPDRTRVTRNGKTVDLTSAKTLLEAQALLADSEAVMAARQLLAEQIDVSTLDVPDMALLTAVAFTVAVGGDVDAPRRLADRYMSKTFGLVKVRQRTRAGCGSSYSTEVSAAWDDLQACMNEANQDERGIVERAARRLACNGVWLGRSETAWFEYLDCISLSGLGGMAGK